MEFYDAVAKVPLVAPLVSMFASITSQPMDMASWLSTVAMLRYPSSPHSMAQTR